MTSSRPRPTSTSSPPSYPDSLRHFQTLPGIALFRVPARSPGPTSRELASSAAVSAFPFPDFLGSTSRRRPARRGRRRRRRNSHPLDLPDLLSNINPDGQTTSRSIKSSTVLFLAQRCQTRDANPTPSPDYPSAGSSPLQRSSPPAPAEAQAPWHLRIGSVTTRRQTTDSPPIDGHAVTTPAP